MCADEGTQDYNLGIASPEPVVSTGSIACGYERKPRRSSTTCTPAAFAAVLKSTRDLGLTVIALQKKHALVRTVVCMSSKLLTLVVLADCAGLKPCSEEPVSNLCTPGAALPTAAEAPLTPIRIFVGRFAILLTFAPSPYTSGDHCTGDTSGDPRGSGRSGAAKTLAGRLHSVCRKRLTRINLTPVLEVEYTYHCTRCDGVAVVLSGLRGPFVERPLP